MRCIGREEGNEWLLSWQQVLETCQSISSLSEQWNGAFSLSVDLAMSFIIFRFFRPLESGQTTRFEH
jgi:hypothetical protein